MTCATAIPLNVDGQAIDFDQGVVREGVDSGSDFLWDVPKRQFLPQQGASGALLGTSYDQIELDNCLSATYGQPISGIDGSTQVTGCYLTSEGRHGKFIVSEWDIGGNLTVVWLTWSR